MAPTLVECRSCEREWHSPTMAEGLRAVGSCPRCGGELLWAASRAAAEACGVEPPAEVAPAEAIAPHLVLGVPRR